MANMTYAAVSGSAGLYFKNFLMNNDVQPKESMSLKHESFACGDIHQKASCCGVLEGREC